MSDHEKTSSSKVVQENPSFRKRAVNVRPVRSSTKGYLGEILTPQLEHLPVKKIQESTGIFSYHVNW